MGHVREFAILLEVWWGLGCIQMLCAYRYARAKQYRALLRKPLVPLAASGALVLLALVCSSMPLFAGPCLFLSAWLTFIAIAWSSAAIQAGVNIPIKVLAYRCPPGAMPSELSAMSEDSDAPGARAPRQ